MWKFTYSWFWHERKECLVNEIDLCLTSIFLYAHENFNLHKNPQFICRSAIFIIMSITSRLFPIFRIKYFICRIHGEVNSRRRRRTGYILSKLKIHPLYCQVLHFCSCPPPDIYFSLKIYCVCGMVPMSCYPLEGFSRLADSGSLFMAFRRSF